MTFLKLSRTWHVIHQSSSEFHEEKEYKIINARFFNGKKFYEVCLSFTLETSYLGNETSFFISVKRLWSPISRRLIMCKNEDNAQLLNLLSSIYVQALNWENAIWFTFNFCYNDMLIILMNFSEWVFNLDYYLMAFNYKEIVL